jgi:hypothetical protein
MTEAALRLKKACDAAFAKYPSSCSHAVWHVLQEVHDPATVYRVANDMVQVMTGSWTAVTLAKGYDLANKGKVVVGGTKSDKGSGHVVIIYPGDQIHNGGYKFYSSKLLKHMVLPATGIFPRVLSTSSGSWPGAKSCGDKTVWDPWGKNEAFKAVKFWTPKE